MKTKVVIIVGLALQVCFLFFFWSTHLNRTEPCWLACSG